MTRSIIAILLTIQLLSAWGSTGHKIISKNAVRHLPPTMKQLIDQQSFLEIHSTDADTRRTNDTAMFSEQYRHYLDIDDYPNFKFLDRNFNNLITLYGWYRVKENGTNPWITVRFLDSLTAQLKRGDWNTSYQTAADIGHYVADVHNPMHATANYNGQLTNNYGIHSRYESTMINSFQSQITIGVDSVTYVSDPLEFSFQYILTAQSYVDTILKADNEAKSLSGWNGSGTAPQSYYSALWEKTKSMTFKQFQSATVHLASLWYTAWVNAGLMGKPAFVHRTNDRTPGTFTLYQNFPNPFNPSTSFHFEVAQSGPVTFHIYSIDGKQVATLVDQILGPGSYSVDWHADDFSSGVYLASITSRNVQQWKKVVYLK